MIYELPPIWEGQEYNRGGIFGKRILIVGESTYAEEGKDTSKYNVLMGPDHIDGYRDAFRTKLLRVFLNTDEDKQNDIEAFWHSVSFFNFITDPVSGPRIAPGKDMWINKKQPLETILNKLEPNLLVALGYRMWEQWEMNCPCKRELGPFIDGSPQKQLYYFFTEDNEHRTLVYSLKHPSSGFSWRKENPYLMKAIELA